MRTQKQPQSGISLIEVLAAIFIVSVGLLGVLAVIPFGAFQVSKARHVEYAANMLANAAEEIVIRELIKPTTWGVVSLLSSDGTPLLQSVDVRLEVMKIVSDLVGENAVDTGYKITYESQDTITVLNGTRFFWIEPYAKKDPNCHIFCIGSTFDPAWTELMRGQDDLVYSTYDDKRPNFDNQPNKEARSSGKYTWFFTFLPDETKIAEQNNYPPGRIDGDRVEIVALQTNPAIPILNPSFFPPVLPKDWIPMPPAVYTAPPVLHWTADPPTDVPPSERPQRYPNIAPSPVSTNPREYCYFANAVSPAVPVDILACYNRVPSDDRQVECGFIPSLRGGTFILPDTLPAIEAQYIAELLPQTKYVFVTWGPPEQVMGGAWCKIVFWDKSDRAKPRIIVTGELSDAPNEVQVYVPSGVLYHKRLGNVTMR